MFASYQMDLPTGATVVATFGVALLLALGVRVASGRQGKKVGTSGVPLA